MELSITQANTEVELSFIIPTLNEEKNIGRLIDSIHERSGGIPYEITVVDNGSDDTTCAIAEQKGAKVICEPDLNISGLRNTGAQQSRGSVYIFLDGDVELTEAWSREFPKTLEQINREKNIITGSRCGIPDEHNFLHKYWFTPLNGNGERYINSAHLIIHKELFHKLNGFDPQLITGEDTDLSLRAKAQYATTIINNKKLRVLHHGYPENLYAFVKREAWHGTRTNKLMDVICCSPIQLATNIFFVLHLILLYAVLTKGTLLAVTTLSSVAVLVLLSALYKYGAKIKLIPINSVIFYFYYLGRATSIIKVLFKL